MERSCVALALGQLETRVLKILINQDIGRFLSVLDDK